MPMHRRLDRSPREGCMGHPQNLMKRDGSVSSIRRNAASTCGLAVAHPGVRGRCWRIWLGSASTILPKTTLPVSAPTLHAASVAMSLGTKRTSACGLTSFLVTGEVATAGMSVHRTPHHRVASVLPLLGMVRVVRPSARRVQGCIGSHQIVLRRLHPAPQTSSTSRL
jgi:hypothetical protein